MDPESRVFQGGGDGANFFVSYWVNKPSEFWSTLSEFGTKEQRIPVLLQTRATRPPLLTIVVSTTVPPDELEASLSVHAPRSQVVTLPPSTTRCPKSSTPSLVTQQLSQNGTVQWMVPVTTLVAPVSNDFVRRLPGAHAAGLWVPLDSAAQWQVLQQRSSTCTNCLWAKTDSGAIRIFFEKKMSKIKMIYGPRGGEKWSRTPIQGVDTYPPICRPVDLSRSISTVDHDQPTGEHGRYRRSIMINLRENTVDIDGRSRSTNERIRSISTVDHDPPTWQYGRYRRSITIHLLRIGSIVDSGRSIEGVGSVDFIDDTCATCEMGRILMIYSTFYIP